MAGRGKEWWPPGPRSLTQATYKNKYFSSGLAHSSALQLDCAGTYSQVRILPCMSGHESLRSLPQHPSPILQRPDIPLQHFPSLSHVVLRCQLAAFNLDLLSHFSPRTSQTFPRTSCPICPIAPYLCGPPFLKQDVRLLEPSSPAASIQLPTPGEPTHLRNLLLLTHTRHLGRGLSPSLCFGVPGGTHCRPFRARRVPPAVTPPQPNTLAG